ncbi:hypothetical protein ACR78H_04565 [Sphingobacterium siyangense]|uniref:hypothetical protein n=1 Tax=Sphingobacterium siyangense TaxID=459529 RepID=UPI003DA6AC22
MIINYDYLREDQERCMLSPFYVLRYSSDAIFPAAQFSVFPGTDSARGCHAGFWQKVPPGLCSRLYPITIIYNIAIYISIVLNYVVLCWATFAFSNLPLLCCVGGAVDPAGAFQHVFVARCRYLAQSGRWISHPSLPITCFTKRISHRYRQLGAK